MEYDNCIGPFEKALYWLSIFGFPLVIYSGYKVFKNEREDVDRHTVAFAFLGFVYLLISGRALNEQGRRWRPVFLLSFVGLFLLVGVGPGVGICGE